MELFVFSKNGMDSHQDISGTSDAQLRPKIYYFDAVVNKYLYTAWGPKITEDAHNYIDDSVGKDVGNIYYYDDTGKPVGTLTVSDPGDSGNFLYILAVVVLPSEAIRAGYYLAVLGQSTVGDGILYLIIYDTNFNIVRKVNLGNVGTDLNSYEKYMPVLHPVYFATSQGTFYLIGSGVKGSSTYANLFLYNPIENDLHFINGNYSYYDVFSKPVVCNDDLCLMGWYSSSYNYYLKLTADDPFNSSDGGGIGKAFSFNNLVFNFVWNNKIYALTNMLDSNNGLAVKRVDLSNSSPSWETLYLLDADFTPGWAGIYEKYLYIGSNTLNQPGVNNYSLDVLDNLNDGASMKKESLLCADCYVSVARFLPFSSPAGFDTLRFSS